MDNEFKNHCSLRGFCAKGCGRQDKQLNTYDYLAGIPGNLNCSDLVEVQFKHTRKGYYRNDNHLPLEKGDMVAVEATPGHDIGVVTLTGQLVPLQMKKANLKPGVEIKRVYRKARQADLDQYEAAKALEQDTMIRSRKIAKELNLNMKIGDVEYQGDGNKAIFYYIADARVDFRQLIKVLADAFHVRIEMKQIGARQEAGRIGGIGPCGRELCCATWMKNFNSVSTTAARFQDISPNPQKLAGQCAKLKCCLNYEVDTYVEASRKLPQRDVPLETADATYFLFKTDILAGLVTYSTDKRLAANLVTITADRAQDIIRMNKAGDKPMALDETTSSEPERPIDLVEQEDLHRFDKSKKRKNNNKRRAAQGGDAKKEGDTRDKQNTGGAPKENPNKTNPQREENRDRKGGRTQRQQGQKEAMIGGVLSSIAGEANKSEETRTPNNRPRNPKKGNASPGRADGQGRNDAVSKSQDAKTQDTADNKQVPVVKEGRPNTEERPQNANRGGERNSGDNRQQGQQKAKGANRPQNDVRSQNPAKTQNTNRPQSPNKKGGDGGQKVEGRVEKKEGSPANERPQNKNQNRQQNATSSQNDGTNREDRVPSAKQAPQTNDKQQPADA